MFVAETGECESLLDHTREQALVFEQLGMERALPELDESAPIARLQAGADAGECVELNRAYRELAGKVGVVERGELDLDTVGDFHGRIAPKCARGGLDDRAGTVCLAQDPRALGEGVRKRTGVCAKNRFKRRLSFGIEFGLREQFQKGHARRRKQGVLGKLLEPPGQHRLGVICLLLRGNRAFHQIEELSFGGVGVACGEVAQGHERYELGCGARDEHLARGVEVERGGK